MIMTPKLKHLSYGFLFFVFISSANFALAAEIVNPACIPEQRTDWSQPVTGMWIQKALKQQEQVGAAQVVFLGDSITQLWLMDRRWPNGQVIWDRTLKDFPSLNLGVAGDRTENLLWRIMEGKMIDGLKPKVTILQIGTNNLHRPGRQDSPAEVYEGVALLVKKIREKLPETKVLLLGLFPREFSLDAPQRKRVREVNELLSQLSNWKEVFFLDIGDKFLNPDGSADKEILRDGLHLSERGYEIWADNMTPYLQKLLEGKANAETWKINPLSK